MSHYKMPSDMFQSRENVSRYKAKKEYLIACRLRDKGMTCLSNVHYLESQKHYASMKANAEYKEKSRGQTWKEFKRTSQNQSDLIN